MITKNLLRAAAVSFGLIITPALADTLVYKAEGLSLEMKKGAFSSDDYKVWQMITVTNNSSVAIRYATVECGFFHDDLLIARDTEMVSELQPGQSRVRQDQRPHLIGEPYRLPLYGRITLRAKIVREMGFFRFRKRIGSRYFGLNISETGFSASAGVPGFHHNRDLSGRRKRPNRVTISAPGTGLSYVEDFGGDRKASPAAPDQTHKIPVITFSQVAAMTSEEMDNLSSEEKAGIGMLLDKLNLEEKGQLAKAIFINNERAAVVMPTVVEHQPGGGLLYRIMIKLIAWVIVGVGVNLLWDYIVGFFWWCLMLGILLGVARASMR
jgi:hypothetical protein